MPVLPKTTGIPQKCQQCFQVFLVDGIDWVVTILHIHPHLYSATGWHHRLLPETYPG